MNKRILALILALTMIFALAVPAFAEDATGFNDVKPGDTFYKEITWVADEGYMKGYSGGDFGVADNVSRAQVCTIFYRLAGEPKGAEAAAFTDEIPDWCKDAINWANANGVMLGYKDGSFMPNKLITREEFVAVFYRFLEKPEFNKDKLAAFTDADTVLEPFQDAMAWAVENGVIRGTSETTIGPKGLLTRGAMAAILYRNYYEEPAPVQYFTRDDWADDVKAALNDFIALYGKDSPNYNPNSYVVFDFDDTCAIYDVAVLERYHRLQTMQFQFTPEQCRSVLASGFGDPTVPRSSAYSKDGVAHCYNDWMDDIEAAYTYLWNTYGPFTYKGLSDAEQEIVHADPMWAEFAVKMQVMFKSANASEGDFITYPWYKYWNTGMTEDEVYYVAQSAYAKYKGVETKSVKWSTSPDVESKVGVVETSWTEGLSVSANIVELYKNLHDNGIDVWVVSASGTDQVRAAVDSFGLHDYCTGVIAYTAAVKDGKIVNQYDFETGRAWYVDGAGWKKGPVTIYSTPVAVGKCAAINNALCSQYGCGPLAAFGDSAGDYEMVTMYDSLKLVMFLNVGKKVNNAGLLYNVAFYQRDTLGYDLAKANAAGDTLYVIQGRDVNGMRSFRNSNASIDLGKTEETLYANGDAQKLMDYMIAHEMTTADIINTFTMKTAVDAAGNDTGIAYGFRTFYSGYHSLHY